MHDGGGLWDGQQQTLLSRLGGFTVLSSVVDSFYERLLSDHDLAPFFKGYSLERLHDKQVKFCSFAFGGSSQYFGRDIAYAHRNMIINQGLNLTHFDRVIEHFGAACTACGLSPECTAEAKMILGATRPIFDPKRYRRQIPHAEDECRELRATLQALPSTQHPHTTAPTSSSLEGTGAGVPTASSHTPASVNKGCSTSLAGSQGQKLAPSSEGSVVEAKKKPSLKLSQLAKVLAPALQQAKPEAVTSTVQRSNKSLSRREKMNLLLSLLKPEDQNPGGSKDTAAAGSSSEARAPAQRADNIGPPPPPMAVKPQTAALKAFVAKEASWKGAESSDDGDSYLPDSGDSLINSDDSSVDGGRTSARRTPGRGPRGEAGARARQVMPGLNLQPAALAARLSTVTENSDEALTPFARSVGSMSLDITAGGPTASNLEPSLQALGHQCPLSGGVPARFDMHHLDGKPASKVRLSHPQLDLGVQRGAAGAGAPGSSSPGCGSLSNPSHAHFQEAHGADQADLGAPRCPVLGGEAEAPTRQPPQPCISVPSNALSAHDTCTAACNGSAGSSTTPYQSAAAAAVGDYVASKLAAAATATAGRSMIGCEGEAEECDPAPSSQGMSSAVPQAHLACCPMGFDETEAIQSLFEKLGSTETVTACVSVFMCKLQGDPMISHFFQGVDIPHLSRKLAAFFSFIFGGADAYHGRGIAAAHAPLVRRGMGLDHFDRLASHFVDALTECGVIPSLVDEVTMIMLSMRPLFDPESILDLEAQALLEAA